MSGSTPISPAAGGSLTPEQVSQIRTALAELRTANESDLRGAQEKLAALTADGALTDAAMREDVVGAEYMIEDATGILALIDAAEHSISAGEYGRCSSCGAGIAWERLLARPYRSTCVNCS